MSITAHLLSDEPSFVCAICQRAISIRWNGRGRDAHIPPVCLSCERNYSQGIALASHGAFRDRREVRRGLALAEALRCEAMRQTWPASWRTPHATA